jgi:uncharacterized OB-fold protein/acyl dehydratase
MAWIKPLPQATGLSQPFWDGLKSHEVRIQRCDDCQHAVFFPRSHCPRCGSRRLAWQRVGGGGVLYSFTVARVPTLPEFSDEMPQLLAVVALDEGPHLNTTLVGVDPGELKVGQRVRPVFDTRPGPTTLLRYTVQSSDFPTVLASEDAAVPPPPPVVAAPRAPARRQIDVRDLDAMRSLVTSTFSDWSNGVRVTQSLIDDFAALSGDDYWLHTDPVRARAESPFGTTIAQGSLVQVLISRMTLPLDYEITGFRNMVNLGSDRLRFAAPVPAGCDIHARYRIKAVEPVKSGVQVTMEIHVHLVGHDRPSVINELVVLYM